MQPKRGPTPGTEVRCRRRCCDRRLARAVLGWRCARAGGAGRRPPPRRATSRTPGPRARQRRRRARGHRSGRATTSAFFNYTDYERNALRLARLRLFGEWRAGRRLSLVGELRTENADERRGCRRSTSGGGRWPSRDLVVQAGRIPPVIGAFAAARLRPRQRRDRACRSPISTSPRCGPTPCRRRVDDLLRMRGRGWQPSYPDRLDRPSSRASRSSPRRGGTPASQVLWRPALARCRRRRHARARRPCPSSATRTTVSSGPAAPPCICRTGLTVGVSGARGAVDRRRRAAPRCRPSSATTASQTLVGDGCRVRPRAAGWSAASGCARVSICRSRAAPSRTRRSHAWSGFVEGALSAAPALAGRRAGRAARRSATSPARRSTAPTAVGRAGRSRRSRRRLPRDASPRAPRRLAAQLARRRAASTSAASRRRRCSAGSERADAACCRAARRRCCWLGLRSRARRRARRPPARSAAASSCPNAPAAPARPDGRRPRRRAARSGRPAPVGRLPRVGAAAGVRRAAAGPRAHGSARRTVRPARARDHRRHDRRLPEQRHDVPQRVLALARRDRSISAATRRAGPAPCASIGPGIVPVFCDIHSHMSAYILVFSHPFFAVTDDDGRLRIAGVPAGHVHAAASGASSAGAQPRRVTRRRTARRSRPTSRSAATAHEPPLVAHQSDLPGDRAARARRRSASRSIASTLSVRAPGGERSARRPRRSGVARRRVQPDAIRAISSSRASSSPTCPLLKGAAATDDPPTVQPIARGVPDATIGADLFVVVGRDEPRAGASRAHSAGRRRRSRRF